MPAFFRVTEEVQRALGKTQDEIYAMSLSELAVLADQKGYAVRCGEFTPVEKDEGGLSIEMKHEQSQVQL